LRHGHGSKAAKDSAAVEGTEGTTETKRDYRYAREMRRKFPTKVFDVGVSVQAAHAAAIYA
jgi:hypothetical protein